MNKDYHVDLLHPVSIPLSDNLLNSLWEIPKSFIILLDLPVNIQLFLNLDSKKEGEGMRDLVEESNIWLQDNALTRIFSVSTNFNNFLKFLSLLFFLFI